MDSQAKPPATPSPPPIHFPPLLGLGIAVVIVGYLAASSFFPPSPPACTENWVCGSWSVCANGSQLRPCTDGNQCGTFQFKPMIERSCTNPPTPICGNSLCENGESSANCPADCPDIIPPACGDGICSLGDFEDCSACPADCGVCIPSCVENWSCGEWSACTGNTQTRTCTDLNECGTQNGRPSTQQACTPLPGYAPVPLSATTGKILWLVPNKLESDTLLHPEAWSQTLAQTGLLSFFSSGMNSREGLNPTLPPAELAALKKQLFYERTEIIRDNDILAGVEIGALRSNYCTGAAGAANDMPAYDKLAEAGFPNFVANFDTPYSHAGAAGLHPNQCNLTPQQFAHELVQYMKIVHQKYPQAEFTWIENPSYFEFEQYLHNTINPDQGDLKELITLVLDEAQSQGVRLAAFHADQGLHTFIPPASDQDEWGRMNAIQRFVNQQGVRFGLFLYFGQACAGCPSADNTSYSTDEEFYRGALAEYDCFLSRGGVLDDIIPQSFYSRVPSRVVPENQAYTFMYLARELGRRMNDPSYAPRCPALSYDEQTQKFVIGN